MLQRRRHRFASLFALCALLIAALGPGTVLHAFGDLNHDTEFHDHDGFDEIASGLEMDSCSFEHEHDQSHAMSFAMVCLVANVELSPSYFDIALVVYPISDREDLPSQWLEEIEKPPRISDFA